MKRFLPLLLALVLMGCADSKSAGMVKASDLYLKANSEFGIAYLERAIALCTDELYLGNLSNKELAAIYFYRAKLTATKAFYLGGLPDNERRRVKNDLVKVRELDPENVDPRGIPYEPYGYATALTEKAGQPNKRDDTAIAALEDILAGEL